MSLARAALGASVMVFLVSGCKKECEGVEFTVNVNAMDGAFTTATVTLTENAGPDGIDYNCPSNGDGSYTCSLPDAGTYTLYVDSQQTQVPFYEIYAVSVEVPELEKCDDPPGTHDANLQPESGGV